MAKEESTARTSRIRGGLPGEEWREYVSPGAIKAYEGPLAGARGEASQLRRKGRLVAAHKAEKRAYRIRVRGYDRKRRGEKPINKSEWAVHKGITTKTLKVGPFERSSKELRIRKPTKSENRRRNLESAGKALGGIRTVAAVGAGAGIAEAVQNTQEKTKKAAKSMSISSVKPKPNKNDGSPVVVGGVNKSMDIYDIIGKSYEDPYDLDGLVEINKVFGLGKILGGAKSAFKSHAPESWQKPASELYGGARQSYKQGGTEALGHYGAQAAAPYMPFSLATGAKAAGGVGAAGLGVGGAYLGAKAAKGYAKKKALKYGGIAAAGGVGVVGAGTALGNAVSPRARA